MMLLGDRITGLVTRKLIFTCRKILLSYFRAILTWLWAILAKFCAFELLIY